MNVKDDLLKWSKQNTVRVFMKQRAQDFTAQMMTVVVNLLVIHLVSLTMLKCTKNVSEYLCRSCPGKLVWC